MKHAAALFAFVALAACSAGKPEAPAVPAGAYKLDPSHASLIFRVNHLGMSNYTARFTRFDATLQLDPENPAASQVTATVDPRSLETDYPKSDIDFDAELTGPNWLDAARFPQIGFRSTKVVPTGPDTARIFGELSLHGVTKPITLEAKYNGGYANHPMDPSGARIGFSARGELNRADYGVAAGVPKAGSKFGVSDRVEVIVEAEFTKPKA